MSAYKNYQDPVRLRLLKVRNKKIQQQMRRTTPVMKLFNEALIPEP